MPAGYAISRWTAIGGALLGLGAYINGACVFGAIARFGSGEWAYIVTPIGFYLGCLAASSPLFGVPMPTTLPGRSPVLAGAGMGRRCVFVAFALWRVVRAVDRQRQAAGARWHEALAARVWSAHAATTVIGITFAVMLAPCRRLGLHRRARRARARHVGERRRALLARGVSPARRAALGGWTAGLFRSTRLSLSQLLRCLVGGVAHGLGQRAPARRQRRR